MTTSRIEAFSDGVLAIIITIMVLEMKVPHGNDFHALSPLMPVFLSYVLSFVYLGIYWNNHHHLFQASERVSGSVLWANLHMLFWLSLIPFTTGWMGENGFSTVPVAVYGMNLLMAGFAYRLLMTALISKHDENSPLSLALKKDRKGLISLVLYATAIPLSFIFRWAALAIYVIVAVLWLIPDRRIEEQLQRR